MLDGLKHGRTLNIKLGTPFAPFTLDSIRSDPRKVRQASETAVILDQYQYQMCKICQGLAKQDDEWRKYNKLRVASIHLITTFRLSLEAFKEDPERNQNRLDDILRRLETIYEINEQVLPNVESIKLKTDKKELITKGDLVVVVDPGQVSEAIFTAELREEEIDNLIEDIRR